MQEVRPVDFTAARPGSHRIREAAAAVGTLSLLAALAVGCSSKRADFSAATIPPPRSADGIVVSNVKHLDNRLLDVTMTSPAVAEPLHVDVLLPANYQPSKRRYPSIYLLTGGNSAPYTGREYQGWIDNGAEQLTATTNAIIVTPEGGADGWYTNWYNGGRYGTPEWETFDVDQLVPWVDANFATIADRAHRAIAGASMGGFGALSLTAQHPDLFSVVASFSGGADLTDPESLESLTGPIIEASAQFDGGNAQSILGTPQQNQIGWQGVDPARLAENLAHERIFMWVGQGTPGPVSYSAGGIEAIVHTLNVNFQRILEADGIPSYLDAYQGGVHSNTYFERDLGDALPRIMSAFDRPGGSMLTSFSYKSTQSNYTVWGWSVQLRRDATEFSALVTTSADRFTLDGSGAATVTTPTRFRPGSSHQITIVSPGGRTTQTATADNSGRLQFAVVLGPSNRYTEYSSQAQAHGGTKVYQARVTISP